MSTNPYQPPVVFQDALSPSDSLRPAVVTVFGVLNVLFGITGLCGTIVSAVFLVVPFIPRDNPALQLMEENAAYRLFTQVGVGLEFASCIVLIVAGIGLWQMKRYGRMLSIGYSVYSIIMNVVANIINFVIVFPGMLAIVAEAGGEAAEFAVYLGIGGGFFVGVIGFVYPGLLLFFMFHPNVVAAFKK